MAQEVLTVTSDTEEHYEFIPNSQNSDEQTISNLDVPPIGATVGFIRDSIRRVSSRRLQPRPKLPSIDSDDEPPHDEDVLNKVSI